MIIKYHKGFNTLIAAITVSVLVIAFTFNYTNFRVFDKQKVNIIIHDVNQKIMSLDLGISSTRNLLDDGIKNVNNDIPSRLIALIKIYLVFFIISFSIKRRISLKKSILI